MSLQVSVRLSSNKIAIGQPFEDLAKMVSEREQLPLDSLEMLMEELEFSAQNSQSGQDRQRLEELKPILEQYIFKRKRIRNKPRLSQHHDSSSENIFKVGDFVFTITDLAANDGTLVSSGLQGQILQKYNTDRNNLVYLVKVGDKEISTFAENIRMALRLSTAGEDPHTYDSATETESGAQTDIGGDAVRTHVPPSLHSEKEKEVKYVFNPQHGEWDKVFAKVARLVNGQFVGLPTPASVSPFAAQLQDLNINYQSNPQGTFNAQQVSETLNNTIKTPDEQIEIENEQNQQAEQEFHPQQKAASSGNISSPADHDRSQLEGEGEGRLKTNIDIDGPNQSHQIQTKNKADDDVMDWLPSPYDVGEDGNYKTSPAGPNAWL